MAADSIMTANCGEEMNFYICEFCNFSTNRMVTFTAHIVKCAEKNPSGFTCGKCIFQCKDFRDFQEHCKAHVISESGLRCPNCPFTCVSQCELDKHSCVALSKTSKISDESEISNEFDCQDCKFFCDSSEQFEKHMSARHSVVWDYSCFHCSYRVESFEKFSAHLSLKHPAVLQADSNDNDEDTSGTKSAEMEPIECLYCEFTSESQISVHEHMRSVHSNESLLRKNGKRLKIGPPVSSNDGSGREGKTKMDQQLSKSAHDKKSFACNSCSFRTQNNINLRRHYRRNHTDLFSCNLCDFKCSSVLKVKNHMEVSHQNSTEWEKVKSIPENKYKCDKCTYQTNYHIAIINHRLSHNPKQLNCQYCSFKTRSQKLLKRHTDLRHREEVDLIKSKEEQKQSSSTTDLTFKFFKCDRCAYIARHQENLEKHVRAHDAEYNYKCPHCLFINTRFKNFQAHVKKCHPKEDITLERHPLEKYKYQCNSCSYESNSSEKLSKHQVSHDKNQLHQCDSCQYNAVSHLQLKEHIRRQHPQKSVFESGQCNYTSAKAKSLEVHLQSDENHPIYNCSKCKFETIYQNSFKTHMNSAHPDLRFGQNDVSVVKTEEGEEDEEDEKESDDAKRLAYKCDKCFYSTNNDAVLNVHKKCHESEDCLKCDHCHFLTNHKKSLEKHLLQKHSIKKVYNCENCDYNTKRFDHYKNHVRAHESKYSYSCPGPCSYITIKYASYVCHMRKDHPNEEMLPQLKQGQSNKRIEGESDKSDQEHDDESDEDSNESDDNDQNRLACNECSFTTIYQKSLDVHKKAHKSERAIKCELCDYITVSNYNYKAHVKSTHPESKLKSELYKCGKCDYVTGSNLSFKSHQRAHVSDNQYKCEHCPYITVFYHSICSHMLRYHPEENRNIVKFDGPEGYSKKEEKNYKYYCTQCSFKCMYYKLYCNHIEQLHPGARNEYKEEHEKEKLSRESDKHYTCRICGFHSDISQEMEEHLPFHLPEGFYICDYCDHKCNEEKSFRDHIKNNHKSADMRIPAEMFYLCPCCDFRTKSVETYNVHLVAHPLGEKFDISFKSPKVQNDLNEVGRYVCDICGYRSKNNKQLEFHLLAHKSDRSYDCEHCKFTSVNRQSYRKHLKRTHNIVLPIFQSVTDTETDQIKVSAERTPKKDGYKCEDCGFETSSVSAYKNHMGAHLVPDPLKCPFNCLYRTIRSRWSNMKAHLEKVHPQSSISRDYFFGPKPSDVSGVSEQMEFPVDSAEPTSCSSSLSSSFSSIPVMLPRDDTLSVASSDVVMGELETNTSNFS